MRASATLIVLTLAALALTAQAPARGRLDTAVMDTNMFAGPDSEKAFARAKQAGARYARLMLSWRDVAPPVRRKGFNANDPREPSYNWAGIDKQVQQAAAAGLASIISIQSAPEWAENKSIRGHRGTRSPSIARLTEFTRAIARRYDGTHKGLPRVRHWQIWNEPNLNLYLTPLLEEKKLAAAEWYRNAVNSFAAAVKRVHRDNLVIAGGLAPFTIDNGYAESVAPLRFMRRLLCLTGGRQPERACAEHVRFDIWSHHPYTTGGPRHKATAPGDASLGDLPEMRNVLRAAERLGTIRSGRPVRFWVTEFSWDSSPPDPKGVPAWLHARWTSEALYRMWKSDVSLVTWFTIRDQPFDGGPYQSGLWYATPDRAKPSMTAFRFPFVAFPRGSRIEVWGRTPRGSRANVAIEQRFSGGWRTIGTIGAGTAGIFQGLTNGAVDGGPVRARIGRVRSLAFSLKDPGDRRYPPFGSN